MQADATPLHTQLVVPKRLSRVDACCVNQPHSPLTIPGLSKVNLQDVKSGHGSHLGYLQQAELGHCRYPNNPVLKVITPRATCRDMDVYPVKLTQEAISVDVTGASRTSSVPRGKGGADSSVDNNNVFSDDSRPYYEGQDPDSKPSFHLLSSFCAARPCAYTASS